MSELVETGKRPTGLNPCYVKCPSCEEFGDYWQTAYNTVAGEEITICCLSCKKGFKVVSMGDAVLRVADNQLY
jgi:hypothetical protein